MDRAQEITIAILVFLPLVFIGVDVILATNKTKGDTYSEILQAAGRRWQPLIMMMCFGFGLLAGHWWW